MPKELLQQDLSDERNAHQIAAQRRFEDANSPSVHGHISATDRRNQGKRDRND